MSVVQCETCDRKQNAATNNFPQTISKNPVHQKLTS